MARTMRPEDDSSDTEKRAEEKGEVRREQRGHAAPEPPAKHLQIPNLTPSGASDDDDDNESLQEWGCCRSPSGFPEERMIRISWETCGIVGLVCSLVFALIAPPIRMCCAR